MDQEWVKTRRALLKSVKLDVKRRLGAEPDDLKNYDREAKQLSRRRYRVSSKSELLSEIESADVVYGGDFHAHGPSQRTHFKLLRHLSPERPMILALECFDPRAQKHIDAFLSGQIESEQLRKRSKWDERWGFPWEHYRVLIDLAKKRRWRIAAIGRSHALASTGLERQDRWTANLLRELILRSPGALIYILIGELHLTRLPAILRKVLPQKSRREVAIHLNAESVYFELAAKGLEHTVDIVRYGGSKQSSQIARFGVLSSPPWVPWQSYLLHLDKSTELEWDESSDEADDFDPTDHVLKLVEWMAKDLGIRLNQMKLNTNDLAIYGASDSLLWRKAEAALRGTERDMARRMLVKGRSFLLPAAGVGCCAQMTVNHASHLAGEYLQMKVSGRTRPVWRFPADFEAAIFVEGLSYFGSKLINHKRQAETISDLRSELLVIEPTDEGRDALRLALDQRMTELVYFHQGRRRKRLVKPAKRTGYLEAALILGRMLGERLYDAYRARKISKREIANLFKVNVLARDFGREYDAIVVRLAKAVGTEIAPSGLLPSKARRERI